jgi:hypothetical protein
LLEPGNTLVWGKLDESENDPEFRKVGVLKNIGEFVNWQVFPKALVLLRRLVRTNRSVLVKVCVAEKVRLGRKYAVF